MLTLAWEVIWFKNGCKCKDCILSDTVLYCVISCPILYYSVIITVRRNVFFMFLHSENFGLNFVLLWTR